MAMDTLVASRSATSAKNSETLRAVRAERHARFTWCSLVLLMLGGSVGMWIYAAVLAVSDPSMAVVPDYHEKALQWDKHLAVERATHALGWTVAYVPGEATDAAGTRELTLFVRDRDARPVGGASGHLRLYHHARAGQAATVPLTEKEPGTYVCHVAMGRAGYWQMELALDRGAEHIETESTYELAH